LRTNHERSDVQNVLDGDLNDYIKAYLMSDD
jgi:peptide chain release factor 2